MELPVCDYADYDYKKEFWEKTNRQYEEQCEYLALNKLFQEMQTKPECVMDAGCGFGRLFPVYETWGQKFILFDYAANLLKEAQKNLGHHKNIEFIQGNLYRIPVADAQVDVVVSVRVLHHIVQPELFFREIHRVLKEDGYFIFEIPNQRHLLNIFRFLTFKLKHNPFSHQPYFLNPTFVNYHPDHIRQILQTAGFSVQKSLNVSYLRSAFLKRKFSLKTLCFWEQLFQQVFSCLNLTPSVYVLCRKR